VVGGAVAIYANAEEQQNTLILVLGILVLMFGIYRLSSTITSKSEKEDTTTYIEEE